jgi:thiol-disulfide isomerase/thioredoxin
MKDYLVLYNKYKNKYIKAKKELNFQTGGKGEEQYVGENKEDVLDNKTTVYLFKASWCGHCKNFKETWNATANMYKNNINFIAYDSEKNKEKMTEWDINGYPSIKIRQGSNVIDYNGDRDLNSFVSTLKTYT